jgi:hypothetical protein
MTMIVHDLLAMHRTASTDRPVRTDAESVADAIRDVALCAMCLSRKIGIGPLSVVAALAALEQRATVIDAEGPCAVCKQEEGYA